MADEAVPPSPLVHFVQIESLITREYPKKRRCSRLGEVSLEEAPRRHYYQKCLNRKIGYLKSFQCRDVSQVYLYDERICAQDQCDKNEKRIASFFEPLPCSHHSRHYIILLDCIILLNQRMEEILYIHIIVI